MSDDNANLVQQAPAKMPEIVRAMHDTAAKALEDAADMLEHEMQSHVQMMRDEASLLRTQGQSQANTIEALSTLIRDTHNTFRQQADKLAGFRSGESNGQGSRSDLELIERALREPDPGIHRMSDIRRGQEDL